jgi:SPP1 gp7 family putative phage head morphogenesis protein
MKDRPDLSLDFREDPAGTKTLIKEYIEKLQGPFDKFIRKTTRLIQNSEAHLAHAGTVQVVIDYQVFRRKFIKAAGDFFAEYEELAPEITKMAYEHGGKYGQIQLKALGVAAVDGLTKADEEIMAVLVQRTLNDLKGFTDELSKTVNREVLNGIINGEGSYTMATRVKEVMGGEFWKAERIARSESMYALNEGTLMKFGASGVRKAEIVATYDDRTCDACSANDGKVYDIEDARGILPWHGGCRCTWKAIVDWSED